MGNGGKRDGGVGVFVKLIFFFFTKPSIKTSPGLARRRRSRAGQSALQFSAQKTRRSRADKEHPQILRSQEQTQRLLYDIKELLYTAFLFGSGR